MSRSISTLKGKYHALTYFTRILSISISGVNDIFSCRHLLTVDICKHHIFYPHRKIYAIVNLRNKKEILVKHQPEPRNQLINTKGIRLYEACSVYFNFTVKNEK